MNNLPILKKINIILSIFLFLLGTYILSIGLIPEINLQLVKASEKTSGFVYKSKLATKNNIPLDFLKQAPLENRLIIPKVFVNGIIYEGESKETLNLGLWRRPKTSTPEKKGNTVITAHRFLYSHGPNTFYHLDKLNIDDEFIIFWKGVEYDYKIFGIKEVEPNSIEIENNTNQAIVTLYTCTPLFSSQKRLVITAKRIFL